MGVLKILFPLLALVALASSTYAQDPHSLLWDDKPDEAMKLLKADPSWANRRDGDRRTPLHVAARFGHLEVVAWLLQNNADVNIQAYNRFTPLHLTEHPEAVKLILKHNPDLSLKSAFSETPLQSVLGKINSANGERKKELETIAKLYIQHGAEVDLISAIRLGSLDRTKDILKENPDFAHRFNRRSPLREAAKYGQLEICKYLIKEHRVDVDDFEGGAGYPVIKSALMFPEIVQLLVDNGADLERGITWTGGRSGVWIIGDNATALHHAASAGPPETIKILLDNGVPFIHHTLDDFEESPKKQSALDVAATFGKYDNMKALLAHPEYLAAAKSEKGLLDRVLAKSLNPISSFYGGESSNCSLELIEMLIDAGSDPNAKLEGKTIIQITAESIHPDDNQRVKQLQPIIRLTHQSGCELNTFSAVAFQLKGELKRLLKQDPANASASRSDGYPALHMAIAAQQNDIAKMLIAAGPVIEIKNESETFSSAGESPLCCAIFWNNETMLNYLIKQRANPNAKGADGNTPLHEAAYYGKAKMIRLLLAGNANPTIKNEKGETPHDIAKDADTKAILVNQN